MKKLVRCKSCGYIMEERKLGEKCPACGAPKTAFEPYTDPMSASRRRKLNMQLHPVAVHFPISFAVAVLVFSIAVIFLSGDTRAQLISATRVLVLLIPVLVIISAIVGYIDGKVRFRKIKNSRILQKKIYFAVGLFIVAAALAVVIWIFGLDTAIFASVSAGLAAIEVGLVTVLALLGTSIMESAFPGN